MRVAYLGTSDFAAGVLRAVAGSPHDVALVVTRPDRPKGRGRRLQAPPVADAARELGLPLDQPASVNTDEARERLRASGAEALVVCAFGALIKEPLLSDFEVLNVHPSLLPRWRGAAPVERAILAGDAETGVAIMRLTEGLDEGPVCLMEREPIHPDDTYGTLAARLEALGARLLLQALDGPRAYAEQPGEGVTYAEKLTAADRELRGADPVEDERRVRALAPHIGARLPDVGVVWAARARPGEGAPAATLRVDRDEVWFGDLQVLELTPAGGRRMTAAEFARGRAR